MNISIYACILCLLLLGTEYVVSNKLLLLTVPLHFGTRSHLFLMKELAGLLTDRNHSVDMVLVRNMTIEDNKVNVLYFDAFYDGDFYDEMEKLADIDLPSSALEGRINLSLSNQILDTFTKDCESQLTDVRLQKLLKDNDYDLLVIDQFNQCGFLQAALLGKPFIVLECSYGVSLITDASTPLPLSFIPMLSSELGDYMNFFQRLKNFAFFLYNKMFLGYVTNYSNSLRERLNISTDKSIAEIKQEAELWLINSDFSLEFPRPLMPDNVYIGGMTCKPHKPLSQEFEELLSNSQGAIVVSFGSGLNLRYAPKLVDMLLTVFEEMPQHVIWSSLHPISTTNPRVKVLPWIPQNDLLGHSKVKLLIGHGGVNGVWEALYHAKPIFIIKATLDAPDNGVRVSEKGYGLWSKFSELTPETLSAKLNLILNTDSFYKKALKYSSILREQPMNARERAVFWTEHILKHGDGKHLYGRSRQLNFVQYYSIDVSIFAFLLISLVFYLIYIIVRLIIHKMCNSKQKDKKS